MVGVVFVAIATVMVVMATFVSGAGGIVVFAHLRSLSRGFQFSQFHPGTIVSQE